MKIAFFVDKISFGGGERILQTLVSEFVKLGNSIVLYTYNKEWLSVVDLSYDLVILSCPPLGFVGKLMSIKELLPVLKKDCPDCIIVFPLNILESVAFAGFISKIPVITSERVDPRYMPSSYIHKLLKKFVYLFCSGIVFQTDTVRSLFSSSIQRKSIVIPNMIMDDLPEVYTTREKEVVAIGRLSPEKNFDLLIEVFSQLKNTDYVLSIYGDGPSKKYLSNLIVCLNMEERIFLKGKVPRVVDHIKSADIFVLLSKHEGMPNALIEAMAMGLACIATDVPSRGCRAIIQHGKNGLLIPVQDKESLFNALMYYITNKVDKESIQKEALNIRKTNNKDIIIPQWINYIKSIVINSK